MTDSSGTPTYAASYDPYGNPLDQTSPTATNQGYTGQQTDSNGLIYLRARYYNPAMGTFLNRDPFGGVMGRSGSLNGYSYVEGNPVNYRDPSGKCITDPISFVVCASIIVGAGFAIHNEVQQIQHYGYVKDWGSLAGSRLKGTALTAGIGLTVVSGAALLSSSLEGVATFGTLLGEGAGLSTSLQLGAATAQGGLSYASLAGFGAGAGALAAYEANLDAANAELNAIEGEIGNLTGRDITHGFDANNGGVSNFPDAGTEEPTHNVVLEVFGGPEAKVRRDIPGNENIINVDWDPNIKEGIRADARELPLADDSVDRVYATNPWVRSIRDEGRGAVREFQKDFLSEFARVLRPGGSLIISGNPEDNPFVQIGNKDFEINRFARSLGFSIQTASDRSPYFPLDSAYDGVNFYRTDENVITGISRQNMVSVYMTLWR
jgi:RHS repeat-associated protein